MCIVFCFFFFFKQKTAYEIMPSLVGSEMCIRDSSYSGCKPAIGDVIMGTAALAAEVNNIHKQSHVREKLAELIMTTELGYAAGYTASDLGKPEVYIPGVGFMPYGPGSYTVSYTHLRAHETRH